MAGDPTESPGGRALLSSIGQGSGDVTAVDQIVKGHDLQLKALATWQSQINGALLVAQWLGAGGILGLALTLWRMLQPQP
jgi:hypothetical protein